MYLLGILYSIIGVLVVAGITALFLSKKEKMINIIIIIVTVFCMLTTLLNVTSLPSNFIAQKIIGYGVALIAIIGNYLRFYKNNYSIVPKVVVAISTIGAFLLMVSK